MEFAIASDHAGFELKKIIVHHCNVVGLTICDFGPNNDKSCDYPDFAKLVASWVNCIPDERHGILICGSGSGMAAAANKFSNVIAVPCYSEYLVRMARKHNNANVLCLGARYTTPELAIEYVDTFFSTPFDGGRHLERVNKIKNLT